MGESRRVGEGDRIVEVNGVSQSPLEIRQRLQEDALIKMRVLRREEFQVDILKEGGSSLGMDVNCKAGREGLTIIGIRDTGLAHQWNMANPSRSLRIHDRIVEVNGFKAEPKEL